MKHRTRIYISAAQRADIWDPWHVANPGVSLAASLRESPLRFILPFNAAGDSPPHESTIMHSPEHVFHETSYRRLYIQARGVLKKELQACLGTQRAIRHSKHASLKRQELKKTTNAVSINDRPASVEDRAVPGYWEGDLIGGTNNSYSATLVECQSRYSCWLK